MAAVDAIRFEGADWVSVPGVVRDAALAPCMDSESMTPRRQGHRSGQTGFRYRSFAPGLPPLASAVLLVNICAAAAETVRVNNRPALLDALRAARAGTSILIEPGTYDGGLFVRGLRGTPEQPIVVAAADPNRPPVFRGGANGLHLAAAAHVELRSLVFEGAADNGLNIDDGGDFVRTPATGVRLIRVCVADVGPRGNRDGIKLSGVTDFELRECRVERWGDAGSAVDMVGCHRGLIVSSEFQDGPREQGSGVQIKGGSSDIRVQRCRFVRAGARAINIGGSTGLEFFRPQPPAGYEARDIHVEGNLFIGSQAPIAFVGVDGAIVRFNTIYHPERWALRILQENRAPGFVPCRNGRFTENIVVFRSDRWASGGVNVGPDTAPETFEFERNVWYCSDRPSASAPRLPRPERDARIGVDPRFSDPERGDFTLQPGSPAVGRGHTAFQD